NTYGTGCFLLLNTGQKPTFSKKGLITTIAWQKGDETIYALEGSVFIGGAAIQWLRDGLKLINDAAETDQLAQSVDGSNGVYFVPAFAGLGAPYWNMEVKGSILGITRDTTKAHIVSATLEGIAYQSMDVLKAMEADGNVALKKLKVDGGATANQYLMQFQADILNPIVEVAYISESTALGVAILASLSLGLTTESTLIELSNKGKKYLPNMSESQIKACYQGWKDAIRRIS
ncbi:MAG TPA: glycerol kinase, partial [Saprospiraceae bacterium]|nr:glycerol kinase [Saprospiraceae bacterium]